MVNVCFAAEGTVYFKCRGCKELEGHFWRSQFRAQIRNIDEVKWSAQAEIDIARREKVRNE